MLFIGIVSLLIIVGLLVIYISLTDNKKEVDIIEEFDYKNTDFFQQLANLDIKDEKILKLKEGISNYIVGSDNLINSIIVAILANGHILVEGVPGLAKTKTILVLSKFLGLDFKRIQFTPDMLPADLIGGEIYDKNTGEFKIFKGPIFTNLLLADEINRTTPKVQSGLLEAMQERKVTIGKKTFSLPKPFFVMATQNPIEQEGTFPLPEAQLDRFLFKVKVDYPSFEEEKQILDKFDLNVEDIKPLFSKEEILLMQDKIKNIIVPEKVKDYIIKLVEITRQKDENISLGASTRGIIALKQGALACAYLQGKDELSIEDVKKVALLALRHRVVLSYMGLSKNIDIDELLIKKFITINDY